MTLLHPQKKLVFKIKYIPTQVSFQPGIKNMFAELHTRLSLLIQHQPEQSPPQVKPLEKDKRLLMQTSIKAPCMRSDKCVI